MPQMDGKNQLERMEFAYSGGSYKFNINPQNMTMTQPHRSSVIKTQSTYVIDDFNDDVQTIRIAGTTGGLRMGGESAIMSMWKFLDGYSNQTPSYGQAPREPLTFYNHTENYAFSVVLAPEGYEISRSVDSPLNWNYEINLIVIGYAGSNVDETTITATEVTTEDTNKSKTGGINVTDPDYKTGGTTTNNNTNKGSGYKKGTQSSKSKLSSKDLLKLAQNTQTNAFGQEVKSPLATITGK